MVKNLASSVGTLYIVATPIGHLEDISFRAIETLNTVDIILAEDTRHSLPLLNHYGIRKPLWSLHAHNESHKLEHIINTLKEGKSLALISDAGTPLISDPGFALVRFAREQQIPVKPIPGACALITALCAAGVACDTFTFMGFLPAKPLARKAKLQMISQSENTLIFYESTHRIMDCLEDILAIYGTDYKFVLAKELTKTFEQFLYETGKAIKEWLLKDAAHSKGEFVLILPSLPKTTNYQEEERILSILLDELPLKQAVKMASQLTSMNKNELYAIALNIKKTGDTKL